MEESQSKIKNYRIPVAIVIAGALIAIGPIVGPTIQSWLGGAPNETANKTDLTSLEKDVLPAEGIVLPIRWGDLGKKMVEAGVIDKDKFEAVYERRGGLDEEANRLLYGEGNKEVKMDAQNAGFLLNMLWAFGLANKNEILEEGPMSDPQHGGADRFASTGGWTMAKGNILDHYSTYEFVTLTPEQQKRVEEVSKNIYRPCCGNSVYFPDCNHGMAMLGLLELMASQGVGEKEMYEVALRVNSYWFPSTYLTIAKYFEGRDVKWSDVDAKELLGSAYSSGSGFQSIRAEVDPVPIQGGGGCGV
jgi:hypothetical protein